MTVPTGFYQSTTSGGFLFGIIASPLLIIAGVLYLYWQGFKSNDKFRLGSTNRFPKVVFIYRVAALCISIFIVFCVLLVNSNAWTNLAYFSTWNAILSIVYFVIGCLVSYKQAFQKSITCESQLTVGDKRLLTAHQIIGEMVVPTSWIVTTVLWGLSSTVSVETVFGMLIAVLLHLFNALALTVDYFMADYLVNVHHFPAPLILICLYYFWHLIANATFGMLCYVFMITDSSGSFIGFYLAGLGIALVLFAIMFGISILKSRGMCCNQATPAPEPQYNPGSYNDDIKVAEVV